MSAHHSSVFKLNQTCFVESSLLMSHGFLNTTRKPNARVELESRTVKIKRQRHVDHVLRCQTVNSCHRARRSISKPATDPAAFVSLSAREDTRVVAGQIVTTTLQRPTALGPIHSYGPCSQRPEHPVVPGREEHRRTGTTSLFT